MRWEILGRGGGGGANERRKIYLRVCDETALKQFDVVLILP